MNIKLIYKKTLNYLFSQLPMYQRLGKVALKKDLKNIKALCKYFDQPQLYYPTIHIAGTNGKGSTAHMLAATLQSEGYKTGLYTSPHYRDFRERIKINGQYISKEEVIKFVQENKKIFKEIQPSFFEITVALAFYHFAKQKVDVAVVETGLGGRLDSTNIINPILSIITNISFDHESMLGNTLKKIAKEKAGIIKKNVPVIIGEKQEEIVNIFEAKAKSKKAQIYFASDIYKAKVVQKKIKHTFYEIKNKKKENIEKKIKVNIHGSFQNKNLVTVLTAIDVLNMNTDLKISKPAMEKGLANLKTETNFIGRWQLLQNQPSILCDSAHNEAGLKSAMAEIKAMKFNQLHIVIGMVNDKSIEKLLGLFPSTAQYYFAKANIPRGLDAKVLKEKAADFDLKGRSYSSVRNALKAAKRNAKIKDLIYVGGSTFVVAEVI